MRPTSSTYSSLNFLSKSTVIILALLGLGTAGSLSGCTKKSETTTEQSAPIYDGPNELNSHDDATGKGNGGNGLSLTQKDVLVIFETLKPRLKVIFEGLVYMVKAEELSPGSTELSENPEMLLHLKKMFGGKDPAALKDLATVENLVLQDEACIDLRGVQNAAAAISGDVGGPICFSKRIIRKSAAMKNFDHAAEIFVLALATHEFVHHFVSLGSHEADEKAAQEVQNFVEQRLVREVEIQTKDIISADETKYLEQFRQHALDVLDSIIVDSPEAK